MDGSGRGQHTGRVCFFPFCTKLLVGYPQPGWAIKVVDAESGEDGGGAVLASPMRELATACASIEDMMPRCQWWAWPPSAVAQKNTHSEYRRGTREDMKSMARGVLSSMACIGLFTAMSQLQLQVGEVDDGSWKSPTSVPISLGEPSPPRRESHKRPKGQPIDARSPNQDKGHGNFMWEFRQNSTPFHPWGWPHYNAARFWREPICPRVWYSVHFINATI